MKPKPTIGCRVFVSVLIRLVATVYARTAPKFHSFILVSSSQLAPYKVKSLQRLWSGGSSLLIRALLAGSGAGREGQQASLCKLEAS